MSTANGKAVKYHGSADVAVSRYFALYVTQIGWIALGVYLLKHAYWPSTCQPDTFMKLVTCSIRLPENRGWIEAGLMTWLWSTPLLVALEVSRRLRLASERPSLPKSNRKPPEPLISRKPD